MANLTTWQATIQDDDTGAAVVSPVVTVRLGGPSGDLADLFDINGDPIANPVTGGADGFVQFQFRPGRYWVQAADGGTFSSAWYVDADGDLNWETRAELVSDWTAGMNLPNGAVLSAGGVQYEVDDTSTDISDLVGVKPFGDVAPEHFATNATPGTSGMTQAVRDAVSYAGGVAASIGHPVRVVMNGAYFLGDVTTYDPTTDWRHHVYVPANVHIVGSGHIYTNTPFASRALVFSVRGSNVRVEGLTFTDTYAAASSFVIPVGAGSEYDSGLSGGQFNSLSVEGCTFNNSWLSTSVQMDGSIDATATWSDISFRHCVSRARPAATSSGNFNMRSDPPGLISNGIMSDCEGYDGKTASAFNFVGVYGFTCASCASYRNEYAGTEVENGCQDGVITGFRSVLDTGPGVWIDDSRRVTVQGVSHTAASDTDAILITREGFSGDTSYRTEAITVSGVVSDNGSVQISSFGAAAGSFGEIVIDGFVFDGDGATTARGVNILDTDATSDITVCNTRITGASGSSVLAALASGSTLRLHNVKTKKVASESSTGITTSGTGSVVGVDIDLHSNSMAHTGSTNLSVVRIDGVVQPDENLFSEISIDDDSAAVVVLPVGVSSGLIWVERSGSGTSWGQFRSVWSGSFAAAYVAGTNGATFDVNGTAGALSGTTGTDGNTTVRVNTDGNLYIENRAGSTGVYKVKFLS